MPIGIGGTEQCRLSSAGTESIIMSGPAAAAISPKPLCGARVERAN
ncbi:MAG: hypothetical protein OK454_11890 [Thaumarchaeota archaeon]|nr:hypothetical protein [Nitrososphaerota archaeon]